MPILAWLMTKLGSGFVTAIFGQIAAIYAKSKDTKLAGLQAVLTANTTDDANVLKAVVDNNAIRERASHSWVAMSVVGLVAIPAAIHWAGICLDSIPWGIPGVWHHVVGSWGIPPLPGKYEDDARGYLETFFIVAPLLPVASGLSAAAQRIAAKL